MRVLTPWAKIIKAAREGRGIRLTAKEVEQVSAIEAVMVVGTHDLEVFEQGTRENPYTHHHLWEAPSQSGVDTSATVQCVRCGLLSRPLAPRRRSGIYEFKGKDFPEWSLYRGGLVPPCPGKKEP